MAITNPQKAQLIIGILEHQMRLDLPTHRDVLLERAITRMYNNGRSDEFVARRIFARLDVRREVRKLIRDEKLGDTDGNGKVSPAERRALFALLRANLVTEMQKYAPTSLTPDKLSMTEGDTGITYTVTGTPNTTLNWHVDAAHAADVVTSSGTVTIGASGVGTFTVVAINDGLVEGNEQFTVSLTIPPTPPFLVGPIVTTGIAQIIDAIIPPVPPVTVTPNVPNITEGESVTFTVQGAPGETLTWTINAENAGDVTVATGTVTLNAAGTGFVTITALLDQLAEGTEQFIITLTNSAGVVVGSSSAVSISDAVLIPSDFITLKEVVVPETHGTPPVTAIYWGYNPHGHGEGGVDNDGDNHNGANEGPGDGGIPVGELISFLTTITGLDLAELGLIDADGQDPFQNVTSLTLGNPITISPSNNPNNTGDNEDDGIIDQSLNLRIEFADGTFVNAEAVLGGQYFNFLNNLLFDNEGNSRLFEKEIVPGTPGAGEHFAPIILTTTQNNGGTHEPNAATTHDDDLIISPRLELLHQAYIDGGQGYNILEVDAKGTYAQPLALRNIQEIRVNDLPNFYTVDYGDGDGYLENTLFNGLFPSPDGGGSDHSWFDISRATEIQKLVVTDSGFGGNDGGGLSENDGYSGDLNIVGVRNGATLRLEGAFISGTTTIQYGQGQTGTLNLELVLGDVTEDINILQNASVLHIDSQGIENHMHQFFAGGSVSRMIVVGTGVFAVDEDLHDSFNQGRPAIIDASANTGGLDVTLNEHENDVTVLGTSNNDEIEVKDADGLVIIHAGEGRNKIVARGNPEVEITAGAGRDDIDVTGSEIVFIDAGDGQNLIVADDSLDVTIIAGNGNNTISADSDTIPFGIAVVDITTGTGNDTITAVRADTVTIDAGDGVNRIEVSAYEINITTGNGNDTVTLSGLNTTFDNGDDEGGNGNNAGGFNGGNTDNYVYDGHFVDTLAPGALINLNLGAGNNTINLGRDVDLDGNGTIDVQFGLTALEGSVITGTGIRLFVENNSDLTEADLTATAITSVVLKQELRITADQFSQIGSPAFSVQFDEEGATEDLYIVVTENTTLSELVNLAQLSTSVRLHFEIHNHATLTLSAEQLHKHVAVGGIVSNDGLNGKIIITDAGLSFDPFDNGDNHQVIAGGTLFPGFFPSDDITIIRTINGFNRPEPDTSTDTTLIDSTGTETLVIDVPVVVTSGNPTTVKIIGDQDVEFTDNAWIDLGPDPTNDGDSIDFSELDGQVIGLTVKNFQNIETVLGNNTGTRIDVELSGNVGSDAAGLKTAGVETYVVTSIEGPFNAAGNIPNPVNEATFWLSDTSLDLQVIGLQGDLNTSLPFEVKTLTFGNVPWGLVHPTILLEGDGYADWNGGLKVDANPNAADIANIVVNYFAPGAPAIVDINNGGVELGVTTTGGERYFDVGTITLGNAISLELNVTEGDAVIAGIHNSVGSDSPLETLTVTATEDVTVTADLPESLTVIDAAGVDGAFAVSVNKDGFDDQDFSFTGSEGGSTLTFTGDFTADDGSLDGTTTAIDGGVGGVQLVLDEDVLVSLSNAVLTNVTGVTLDQESTLSLTLDQADAIGAGNFALALGATSANLGLTGLADQEFAVANYATGIAVTLVELADLPVITLHPDTDLTGIGQLVVHEGTVLNLTAAQFQQLDGTGLISGIAPDTNFTVNITDLTQADIDPLDLNGDGDYTDAGEHAGFSLAGITGGNVTVTVTLAESVELANTDSLVVDGSLANTTVNIGGFTLTLADVQQANALTINGEAGGILKFFDTFVGPFESIDASGFNVETLQFLNVLAADRNVDLIFLGLPESVEKVIYTGLGWVEGVNQTVTLEEGTTVPGFLVFNKPEDEVEIRNFTLNLQGGTEISGNLRLSTTSTDGLIKAHLQTVVINSTGTAENLLTGKTANIIAGDITTQGIGLLPGYESVDNNLLNVTINAEQALEVTGDIVFESVTEDDGITANDDDAATAVLTINGSANVTLGGLNTQDDDVDALVVTNAGTGTLSATLNGAYIDQEPDNNDALSFLGSNIELTIVGNVDLSDDVITGVSQIKVVETGELTLSYDQLQALGVANVTVIDGPDAGSAIGDATLIINGYAGGAFDATTLDSHFETVTLVLANQDVELDPGVNLTNVDEIIVQEGRTLTLTAAQFQQLEGNGTITAVDTNGNSAITPINVVITDLTQADVERNLGNSTYGDNAEDGFDLSDVSDANITIHLGEDDVTLGKFDPVTHQLVAGSASVLNGASFVLADNQTLGLVNYDQANGLDVDGGVNTTLIYKFADLETDATAPWHQIDASGYHVTVLKALAASFIPGGALNVEFSIDDLPSSVELRLYQDPNELGFLDPTFRRVVIEEGITTPASLVFSDWDADDEVRTLDLTLSGDVTLNGSLSIPTRTDKDGNLVQRYFDRLTIHSIGDDPNTIAGNVNTSTVLPVPNTSENNLLLVVIDAQQDLVINGAIDFNGHEDVFPDDDAVALLTIDGAANVTVEQLDVSDDEIDVLNVVNNGTGTLIVTGGSPAIFDDNDSLETVNFSGTGNVVLGDNDTNSFNEVGVGAPGLSLIDASGLSGNLNLGEITDIDSADFTLIAGTGVTIARLSDNVLDSTGDDSTPGNADDTAGWNIDYSTAAPGSEFHLGGGSNGLFAPVAGSILNINMGPNGVLYIDETMDLSDLDLEILQTLPIVLADDAILTLTAAQADGLTIIAGPDTGVPGFTGKVNIVDLGTDPVDLSHIAPGIAGIVSLGEDDVTLDVATNLGEFTVYLWDKEGNDSLQGQTIRYTTVQQADNKILVGPSAENSTNDAEFYLQDSIPASSDHSDFTSSTNVVWLFTSLPGGTPVFTGNGIPGSGYDGEIGRLWLNDALIASQGGDVEDLFTTLPNTVLRVDFGDVNELNILLTSTAVNRIIEFTNFVTVGNLEFNDAGLAPPEHIKSLTMKLGGQATVGNVVIGDVIGEGVNPATVSFDYIQIESHRALSDQHILATEDYVNNNESGPEFGETAQPNDINIVGNISISTTDNVVDLTDVRIRTLEESVLDNGSAGAGANLQVGTITYDSAVAGTLVRLDVEGENNVTITSVNTADVDILGITTDLTDFTGVFTAPGASPAFNLANTEGLAFVNGGVAEGTVRLGNNSPVNAGIVGNELSHIDASNYGGELHLGILAQIDGTDDLAQDYNGDGDTSDDFEGPNVAFTFTAGTGLTTATLAAANGFTPTLQAGSQWIFDYGSGAGAVVGSALTITDSAVFQPTVDPADPTSLRLLHVPAVIQGNVNLSQITLDFDADTTVFVAAGNTLTLTIDQVQQLDAIGVVIWGEGTTVIVGDGTNDDLLSQFTALQTVGVDISAVTLDTALPPPQDADEVFTLTVNGALDDNDDPIGQIVTGSANDDVITTGAGDDTITGGAGNDTLTGGLGSDTFLVTSGTDTITDLEADEPDDSGEPWFQQDVLIVSSGATANAIVNDEFFATASTVNNGTANLSTSAGGGVIDVSLAGGTNGFNLTGGDGSDTLIGSAQADTIEGGYGRDELTGGGGADIFRFTTQTNAAVVLTQSTSVQGRDVEQIEIITPALVNGAVSFDYRLNNALPVTVNVTGIVSGDSPATIAGKIAAGLGAGFTAVVDSDSVFIRAADGSSLDLSNLDFGGTGAAGTINHTPVAPNNDVEQVSRVEVPNGGTIVAGDKYSVVITTAEGQSATATYTALLLDDEQDVANGLSVEITGITGAVTTNVTNVGGVWGVNITDAVSDNGGFTLALSQTGGFSGSSASSDVTDWETVDIVTDFLSAQGDKIDFQGLVAGSLANYAEGPQVADYGAALSAAQTAITGTVRYYLTSVLDIDAVEPGNQTTGVLFFDADGNNTVDGAVLLVGVTPDNFAFGDIIASSVPV